MLGTRSNCFLLHKPIYFQADESLVPDSVEERQKKAQTISSSRILGPDEFKIIQQRQAMKEVEGLKAGGRNAKKRKREEEEETETR